METTALSTTVTETTIGFSTASGFDLLQRQAKMLASSALVPKEFQGNVANCAIVLEMANRMGANPLMVAQSLYIVHGKPSWSSQFLIAALNSTGRFSPLRYDLTGEGDKRSCIAWATEKATGERLDSPPVSIAMAKAEGWMGKSGSKWQTMPELMLRYRAATFFCRLYAPEVTMGFQTAEEVGDVIDVTPTATTTETVMDRFAAVPVAGELPMTAEEKAESEADFMARMQGNVNACPDCGEPLKRGKCHNVSCPNAEPV